jgi:hypothetical protein
MAEFTNLDANGADDVLTFVAYNDLKTFTSKFVRCTSLSNVVH